MRAAEWEFRYRFWIIFGLFLLGFACYRIDAQNAGFWLVSRRLGPRHGTDPAALAPARLLFGSAALMAAAGIWLRTWAAAYLRSEVVHDEALHSERVVADGPYRHLRNPLYVGLLLAALAMSSMMSRLGAVLAVAGITVFVLRLIGGEEAALLANGGESYRRFCAAVPRLVPALRPRLPRSGARPRWGNALLGELSFWSFPLALAVFALTFDSRLFLWVIGGGMLLRGVLANVWWRRRRPETS
jgi:hypothetical protein